MLGIWTASIARAAGVELPAESLRIEERSRRRLRPVRRTAAALRRWRERRETRQALRRLDDRLLADIGLDRAMIDDVADGLIRRRAANDNVPAARTPAAGDRASPQSPANDNPPPVRLRYYL